MPYHQGRLIDHIHLRVSELRRSKVFYRAVLQSIGLGDGCGETEECFYHSQYYAAFVLDPDGNNIEVVCDAPTWRSAESVVVERLPSDSPRAP